MRGPLGQQLEWILAHMIWYLPTDSYHKIFGYLTADVLAILHRKASIICGASAVCLDLPSVLFSEEDL